MKETPHKRILPERLGKTAPSNPSSEESIMSEIPEKVETSLGYSLIQTSAFIKYLETKPRISSPEDHIKITEILKRSGCIEDIPLEKHTIHDIQEFLLTKTRSSLANKFVIIFGVSLTLIIAIFAFAVLKCGSDLRHFMPMLLEIIASMLSMMGLILWFYFGKKE